MLLPSIISPPIPPSPLPLSPATPLPLMRPGLQMPFPFASPFSAMPPSYFYSRMPHRRPSFPPPLLYLPTHCPPMFVGPPAFYASPPQNYESPPLVGQVSRMEAALSPDHEEIVHFTLNSSAELVEQMKAHQKRTGREDACRRLMKARDRYRTVGVCSEGSCSPSQRIVHSRRAPLFDAGHPKK